MSEFNLTPEEKELILERRRGADEESAAVRRFNDLAEKPSSKWTPEDCEFVRTNPVVRKKLAAIGWNL